LLIVKYKFGGSVHLKLNIFLSPIVNKYCEGKLKRILKRELKEIEIVYNLSCRVEIKDKD